MPKPYKIRRLKAGDKIGVAAPSDPVRGARQFEELYRGAGLLKEMGFDVEIGRYVSSSSPVERAMDVNLFFSRPDVRAIICARGGDSAETVLPFLQWDTIADNPKIFVGFSDATVLINAIYAKAGLVTFHGPDVCFTLGKYPFAYTMEELAARLCNGKTGKVRQLATSTIRGGTARGRLLGGNLRCLLKLANTVYWPDFTGSIVMLESFRLTGERCVAYISELKAMGVFDLITGVIVGFVYSMQVEQPGQRQMEYLLNELTEDYGFPILKMENFGHACPTTVLPIGCEVQLDADAATVDIMEEFLI